MYYKVGGCMVETQLLKGILEGCVLSLISRGETYGYQIISDLNNYGFTDILEGTLYPVLTRLEKNKYISCRKQKSPYGPIRKYYSITSEGEIYLKQFYESYTLIKNAVDAIIKDGEHE